MRLLRRIVAFDPSDVLLDDPDSDVSDLGVGVRGAAYQVSESAVRVQVVLGHQQSDRLSDDFAGGEGFFEVVDLRALPRASAAWVAKRSAMEGAWGSMSSESVEYMLRPPTVPSSST